MLVACVKLAHTHELLLLWPIINSLSVNCTGSACCSCLGSWTGPVLVLNGIQQDLMQSCLQDTSHTFENGLQNCAGYYMDCLQFQIEMMTLSGAPFFDLSPQKGTWYQFKKSCLSGERTVEFLSHTFISPSQHTRYETKLKAVSHWVRLPSIHWTWWDFDRLISHAPLSIAG